MPILSGALSSNRIFKSGNVAEETAIWLTSRYSPYDSVNVASKVEICAILKWGHEQT